MKNIILLLLLLSSMAYSDAKVYIGLNYGLINESFSQNELSSSSELAKFKIGYGDRKAFAIEFSLDYLQNRSKIFSASSSTTQSDGDKYGFNIEVLKAYDFNIYILPYLKVGFGTGIMKIDRALQNKLTYGSFNMGTGLFIPIDEHYELEIGYEYRNLTYEPLDMIFEKKSYRSHLNNAYIGFNIRF